MKWLFYIWIGIGGVIKEMIKIWRRQTKFGLIDIQNIKVAYASNPILTNPAEVLLDFIRGEITSLKQCIECYDMAVKSNAAFVMACKFFHPIVWAKPEGYCHWPAKVVEMCNNDSIFVRYFGDHMSEAVAISNCFLFSKEEPVKQGRRKINGLYQNAMKVNSTQRRYFHLYSNNSILHSVHLVWTLPCS